MEEIREAAEDCNIPYEDDPETSDLDVPRFVDLIRQSYRYIQEPDDSVFHSDDGDAKLLTYDVLAEQAVLYDDMTFFLKIWIEQDYWMEAEYCLIAIYKTQQIKYWDLILQRDDTKPIAYVRDRANTEAIVAISALVLPYADLEVQFKRFATSANSSLNLANFFLSKGFSFERVCEVASNSLKKLLREENV